MDNSSRTFTTLVDWMSQLSDAAEVNYISL
jgi:hypothetical protein